MTTNELRVAHQRLIIKIWDAVKEMKDQGLSELPLRLSPAERELLRGRVGASVVEWRPDNRPTLDNLW